MKYDSPKPEKPELTHVQIGHITLKILIFTITVFGAFMLGYSAGNSEGKRELQPIIDTLTKQNSDLVFNVRDYTKLSWKSLDFWMKYYEVDCMDVVKAQIYLESSGLESRLCIEDNNLIGMKIPGKRETTASYEIPARDGAYAGYASFIDCVEDIKLYQEQSFKGGDYISFLVRAGHAQDSTYGDKLRGVVRTMRVIEKSLEDAL